MRFAFPKALLLIAMALPFSCNKDEEKKEEIIFEGFQLRDALGNPFGTIGDAADDWQILDWSQLSSGEQSFLNFSDTVDLANTSTSTISSPIAFPNPVCNLSSIQFHAGDSVKLKVALVDEMGNVLKNISGKIKGAKVFYFDVADPGQFPSGKSLRYYYSFSAAGQPNFKAGYGDIKICCTTPYTDCFK